MTPSKADPLTIPPQATAFFFISYNCIYKYTYILRKKLVRGSLRMAELRDDVKIIFTKILNTHQSI